MKRTTGTDGKTIGKYNHKPILDSRKHEVELPDGVVDGYHHNIILEYLLSQVDEEGRESILMKEISDHNIKKYAISDWDKGLIKTSQMEIRNTILDPS